MNRTNVLLTGLLCVTVGFATVYTILVVCEKTLLRKNDPMIYNELPDHNYSKAILSYTIASNDVEVPPFVVVPENAVVPASSTGEQTWWQALLFDALFRTVIPIFLSVLAALAYWVVRKVGLKLDLEVLDKIATNAADYAEHQGAHWLKTTGNKSGGALKERWAWELVESVDAKLGASEALRLKLRNLILSKIPDAEAKAAMKESNGVVAETK